MGEQTTSPPPMVSEGDVMTAPIVAGADGTDAGLDAVALAASLARATGDPLLVACIYPDGTQPGADADVRRHASEVLEVARLAAGGAGVELRAAPSTSSARGLAELAEQERARMLVVGSSNRGAIGRVVSGSTAERLLHGTGCPVAVAPRGYRRPRAGLLRALGVAFVDTAEGHEAVRVAADLAARSGLPLTLYSVVAVTTNWFTPPVVRPEEDVVPEEVRKGYRDALDRALAELPDGVQASGVLLYGDVVDELSMVGEHGTDLLVCGSRGYGPVRRVLLGSVSAALVRQASVPVLVVPRSGDT
jgi:nucleotide-binding universal stress UspA family protein